MDDLPESARYEGIVVDLLFEEDRPGFGDLFTICGYENPSFPPSGRFDFKQFEDLQFSQVDDYFGVQTLSGVGGVMYVSGHRGQTTHAWLILNDQILDITSDQFKDGLGKVYIGPGKKFS